MRVWVRIHYGQRISDVTVLSSQFDLVIASDGGNSAARTQLAQHFGPSFEKRRN